MKTALLLSGGMDSIALAWWQRPDVAITIDYGQLPAAGEINASQAICTRLGIEHYVVHIDCRALGSGDMAGIGASPHAPTSDWWPYRNQMLVTFAAMRAISLGVTHLLLGMVKSDSFHKNGTTKFISAMAAVLSLQEGAISLEAPASGLSTTELIRHAEVPMSVLAWAHSCHVADVACGVCRGCNKYLRVLRELG